MKDYFRPIVQTDMLRPKAAVPLAGGALWFCEVERIRRDHSSERVAANTLPKAVLERLSAARAPICGLSMDVPRLMGILNTTPDSFSDGGEFHLRDNAVARADQLISEGAHIVDIGGESTRPGASPVSEDEEISRTIPVIEALQSPDRAIVVSIDTRKAEVARQAVAAGAGLFNDVSALRHDPDSLSVAVEAAVPVCLMHAPADHAASQPETGYANVLLDVYDYLEERVAACVSAGIASDRIIVDPGIGFGKTPAHNLALICGLALFHGLGCPILFGASRKRFIGSFGNEPEPNRRAPGSVAAGLEALRQGVQILRVHDMAETAQAVAVWQRLVCGQQDPFDGT